MAGDWIKMRNNLWDDPRVSQLCDQTGAIEAAVIGGLYWLWSAADEHTESGHMPGLSVTGIDRKTGIKGLGAALLSIGWITDTPGGITISRFDEHNGSSAKRRAADAQRKANGRSVSASDADNERTERGQDADELRRSAELEKRREELSSLRPESGCASRLSKPFELPEEWRDWALSERPDLDPGKTAQKFADYWHGKPGKAGTKLDWQATWRNWVREERAKSQGPPQETFRERDERRARERYEEMTGKSRRKEVIDVDAVRVD